MTELQEEVVEIIERELLYGFMEEDELLEEVLETFADDDVDPTWIGVEVNKRYAERLREIEEWDPEEANDFDRLANAFDELCERHQLIALHRAGYSAEDGIEEVTEAFKALAERGVSPKGYVFYTTEQLERATSEKARLDLTFGAVTRADSEIKKVGYLIVETLQRYGLDARWNGSAGDAIKVHEIEWQKEPDDEDWGVERAVAIISGEDENAEQQDYDDFEEPEGEEQQSAE